MQCSFNSRRSHFVVHTKQLGNTDTLGLTYIYSLAFSLGLPCNLLSQLGRSGGGGCQLGAHRWPYGHPVCEFVGCVFYVNVYASVVFLCLIALNRCLAIVHSLTSRGMRTVRVAAVAGVAVRMLTFLFYLGGHLPSVFDAEKLLCLEQYPVSLRYVRYGRPEVPAALWYTGVSGKRNDPSEFERSIFLCYRLCYSLTSLNTLLNPLFYIFLCQDARLELRRSLTPCLGRGHTAPKQVRLSLRGHPY
ncbi:unnamed protein product [Coregonus sp. 'balchen']|nr:unnamed protein product [Coregonus sp. 'balchen']